MKPRVYTPFANMPLYKLLAQGNVVFNRMTTNAALYSEQVNAEVAKLGPICTEMQLRIDNANSRDAITVQQKNEYVPKLRHQMKAIANMLNMDYRDDLVALEASGYKVMTSPTPHRLRGIRNISISQSAREGYVKLRVLGAENYHVLDVYVCKDQRFSEGDVEVLQMTKKTFEIGKYPFGTQLFIKVKALGKDDSSVVSRVHAVSVSHPLGRQDLK